MIDWIAKERDRLALSLRKPVNTASTIIISCYTILWGAWIANPKWQVFTHAHIYSWMNSVGPEYYWGTQAIVVGIAMTYGVIRDSYKSLMIGAFIGFLHWLLISVGYFIGDWQNTGGVTSAMISIYCAFVYLNIRINRRNFAFRKDSDII